MCRHPGVQVVREDKVEHHKIDRGIGPKKQPMSHFVLNDSIRLWLTCCVDEVIAEILTVPGLRKMMNGTPAPLIKVALSKTGTLNFLQGILEVRVAVATLLARGMLLGQARSP